MSKNVAVILSGCGVYDGAEIHESVLTLLRLSQQQAKVTQFAPNRLQHHAINHLNGEEMPEPRNMLVEAARIARGSIQDLATLDASQFDALIVPGGFGAAKNFSSFAFDGAQCQVQSDVLSALKAFANQQKPIGLMCIAPTLAPFVFGKGVRCTIGHDADTKAALSALGAEHIDCAVYDIVVDDAHKLVTTPAYMLANTIAEAAAGINKLVDRVLELS